MQPGPLILLHGWAQHAGVWDIVRDRFSDLGYKPFTPDLPGHGQSAMLLPHRLQGLRHWMKKLLDQHEQVFLLGWSLGGVIAIDMISQFPGKITGLITVGTLPNMKEAMTRSARQAFSELLHRDSHKAIHRLMALMAMGDCHSKNVRAYFTVSCHTHIPEMESTLRNGYDMLMNADLEETLGRIEKPCLMLAGENDYFIPREAWQACQNRLPAINFQRIGKTGHAPFVSRPEDFVQRVDQFIRSTL